MGTIRKQLGEKLYLETSSGSLAKKQGQVLYLNFTTHRDYKRTQTLKQKKLRAKAKRAKKARRLINA